MQVEYIPLSSISISEERQRQYFDEKKMAELIADIEDNDLIHPLAVSPPDGFGLHALVAGERRLRALQILHNMGRQLHFAGGPIPEGYAPCTIVRPKDEDAYFAMELAENVCRTDLTWQERADAVAKLHRFREKQRAALGEEQTYKDTARELYPDAETPSTQPVSESLILARHLADDEVRKAKSPREAMKIVKRKAQEARILQLAAKVKTTPGDRHRVLHGDCLSILPTLPGAMFDCILTDPPYGVGAQSFGDQADMAHHYDDSPEHWLHLITNFAPESFRLAKPQAHLYVFCDIRRWEPLSNLLESVGWEMWPTPLIWDKGQFGILPRPLHGPRRTYECIAYGLKGSREVFRNGTDVLSYPVPPRNHHAAEKPVELYIDLLRRSCEPGNAVLDPFAGVGTILPAANALSLSATAIEVDERCHAIALSRLGEGLL